MALAASLALPTWFLRQNKQNPDIVWGRAIRTTQSIFDTTGRWAATVLALVAVAAGSAGAAAAKDLRYPETGPVAFLIHLPDSWSAKIGNSGAMGPTVPRECR